MLWNIVITSDYCTNDFTMSPRQPINWFFFIKYDWIFDAISIEVSVSELIFIELNNNRNKWKQNNDDDDDKWVHSRSKLRITWNRMQRESMIHICCFIKINRDICNWRMTNNKTFTSTFLTCRVNMVASCSIHSFGLFVCLFCMDYSNQIERKMIARVNIEVAHVSLFISFVYVLCLFIERCCCCRWHEKHAQAFHEKKNGNRMTNYLKPLFTFDSSFRMSYQKRWVSFMSQITHIRMSPFQNSDTKYMFIAHERVHVDLMTKESGFSEKCKGVSALW